MQIQTTTILQSKNILVYPKFIYKEKKEKEQYTYKQQQQKRNKQTFQNRTKLTNPSPNS